MAAERTRRAPPPRVSFCGPSEHEPEHERRDPARNSVLNTEFSEEPLQTSLEDRIRSALASDDGGFNSDALADLLTETDEAILEADAAAAGWRKEAENIFSNGGSAESTNNADTWSLIAARLRGAIPKLQARLIKVRNAEDYARWLVQYEATKAEVDAAAAELKQHYQPWVSYICALLAKMKAIDEAVVFVNNNKPQHALGDSKTLRSVEATARGVESLGRNKSIVKDLVLIGWEPSERPAWPPFHNYAAELAMMQTRMFDRREHPDQFTNEWWRAEEDKARQREEATEEVKQIEQRRRAEQPVPHGADWGERT